MEKIAVISDIHGNIPALEAVINDIKDRGITTTYCLGDLVGKGPHPDAAVDTCREFCEKTVKGNWDDFICRETDHPVFLWHQERLGRERLEYLGALPNTIDFLMSGRKARLYHASHKSLYHRVHMNDPAEKQLEMFSNTELTGYDFQPNVVGYGDIHNAFIKYYKEKILFNTGSVGNPLELTLASYAVLEGDYGSSEPSPFSINIVRIPYDIELAIKQAEQEKMPELDLYAEELRTGVYRRIRN